MKICRVQPTSSPENRQIEQRYWPSWTELGRPPAVQALIYVSVCVLKYFSFEKQKGMKIKGRREREGAGLRGSCMSAQIAAFKQAHLNLSELPWQ